LLHDVGVGVPTGRRSRGLSSAVTTGPSAATWRRSTRRAE